MTNTLDTWSEITPALLAVMEDGTPEGRLAARQELLRMARIADLYVAQSNLPDEAAQWRAKHGNAAQRRVEVNTGGY